MNRRDEPAVQPLGERAAEEGILRERARRLARPTLQDETAGTLDVLEFRLANERYAFEASQVHDVQPLRELTQIPCTPSFLRGVVNVRGRLVPVIDLKKFFGLPDPGITDLHRVLLLRAPGIEVGLLADTVEGVHAIAIDSIGTSQTMVTAISSEYLRGITADRLVILDAKAILADPRIIVDEEVES